MARPVKCKFVATTAQTSEAGGMSVFMRGMRGGPFCKESPSAELCMYIKNPNDQKIFEKGKAYKVIIKKVRPSVLESILSFINRDKKKSG